MSVTSDTPAVDGRTAGVWEALRTVRDPELDADVEADTSICRGQLAARYGTAPA